MTTAALEPDLFDRASAEYASLEADGRLGEVNDESIAHANLILELIVGKIDRDWQKVMAEALTEPEQELGLRTIGERRERHQLGEPKGAVAMSTEGARALTDLPPAVAQRAVQLLKSYGRLVQCGRGRGKCLVVLDDTPVSVDVVKKQRRPVAERMAAELDVSDLIRIATTKANSVDLLALALDQIKAQMKAMSEQQQAMEAELTKVRKDASRRVTVRADAAKLKELATELRRAQREISELRSINEAKEKTIQKLDHALTEKEVASWT